MKLLLVSVFVICFVAGCAYNPSIPDEAKYELEKPVDCSTAASDIQILESEKASSAKQAESGIKMIVPAAAARSILHHDYLGREEVATGQYNRDIDAKIKEIKDRCGLQ